MRKLRAKHKIDPTYTSASTLSTMMAAKSSSATGPDGLTSIHLKNLGLCAIAYLTKLYNLSVSSAVLPAIWKAAVIVPILKPGKPANVGSSY